MRLLAATLPVALLLTGCAAASTTASKAPTCVPVPLGALTKRIEALGSAGTALHITRASAVKSPTVANAYFIAAVFTVKAVKGQQTGVWAAPRVDGTGTLLAVDGSAQQFYDGYDADKVAAQISKTDPSVATSKACLT